MRLDRFDLNLLVVLDVLLEKRNVTRASEHLHIGQSATSAALGRLREYFDDSLLVPVGRNMELTPLAKSLVIPVRDTLMRARATISLRPIFEPENIMRNFTVAASDYMINILIGQSSRKLAASSPRMRLDLIIPPKDVFEALERGEIDLLFLPKQYSDRFQHPQTEVLTDVLVCMVCEKNELKECDMEQYLNMGHVAIRLGDEHSISHEDWFLPRDGRQRRIECTVDHFSSVPLLIMGTKRIATLHRLIAEEMAQRFPVKILPAPFEMQPVAELMIWPRYLNDDPAHIWLRNTILTQAKDMQKKSSGHIDD